MAFEVICRFSLNGDADWEVIDARVRQLAGRRSDSSGTDGRCREHGWLVAEFTHAVALKERLNSIAEVTATVREMVSEEA